MPKRTDGGSLRADLGSEYWQRFIKTMGWLKAGNFDHLPPLFAAAALESAAIKDRAFLDAAIAARGAKLGKPTVGLDTVDHDALIFSSLHCVVNKIELDLDDLDLVHKNTLGEIAAYA